MNRKYSTQEFEKAVLLLRKIFEDCILTADIIVGFPGETEVEFNTTYDFLKRINFYKIHVFKYSVRKGTKAAVMENQIDGKIKEQRSKKIIELSDKAQEYYHQSYQNKIVEVLFEEKENNFQKGHTRNYIMVGIEEKENIVNQSKNVKVIGMNSNGLIGKLV